MSEFTNETVGGGNPDTVGGDAPRDTVSLDRRGFGHEYETSAERLAMPSHADVAKGAPRAAFSADTSQSDPAQHVQPTSAGYFGAEHATLALGIPQESIDSAERFFSGAVSFSDDQLEAFDATHQAEAETELRALWGEKYDGNLERIKSYLASLPGGAGQVFLVARDDTGRGFANDPAHLQRVLGQAQQRGAVDVSQPLRSAGDVKAQIASIEQLMRTDRAAYNKDTNLQALLRELYTIRERAR